MAIEKLNMNWKNKGETGAIPINATNLNKMTNKTDEIITSINTEMIKGLRVDTTALRGQANKINATIPSGYRFLCWLAPASYGAVLAAEIEEAFIASTNLWLVTGEKGITYTFHCPYLVIKQS